MNEVFEKRVKEYFGDKSDLFMSCMKEPCTQAFFINEAKADPETIFSLIDFPYSESKLSKESYYHNHDNIGKSKAYELGLIYPQEIAASLTSKYVDPTGIHLIIDMCAAPGGKSTLLQSLLPDGSLLISNEPIAKRNQILSENMQKWVRGLPADAPQVIVTQRYPHEFGDLTGRVDLLLTDVPCSGEGMFRKDEGARREWSMENVMMCQQRQRDILSDIWPVLKPGGLLIYSTCTFNRFEDEDNARWICDELGGELLMERHFLPGRDRGEGFYVAAIRVKSEELRVKNKSNNPGDNSNSDSSLFTLRSSFFVLHSSLSTPHDAPRIDLSYNEALQYLRREALRVEAPRGPVTLCYRGLELGPGKSVGSRINNLYPEAWRIRTTYTTPFSLLGTEG